MSEKKTYLKTRLLKETKTILLVWVSLALLLGSFATYRRLLLAEYQIAFFRYGYSAIEAFVLAKVIVLGRLLGLGERFRGRPLIVPTLYKTVSFSVLVLAFSILEHLIVGLLHGDGPTKVLEDVMNKGIWEILAQVMVLFIALLPLFAVWETDRVLGEGKLFDLFFKQRASLTPNPSAESATEPRV
jgi:hypothetical protein